MHPLKSLALPVILCLSMGLAGCAGAEDLQPAASDAGPVAEVTASTDWDEDHPEYVPRDDYLGPISAQYETWAPGSSWRISGDGWDPGDKITVSVLKSGPDQAGEDAVGDPLSVEADEFGQFAAAYALPKDAETGGGYELRAVSEAARVESTPLMVVSAP